VGRFSGGPGTSDPGRVTASRISLDNLIYQAYALMNDQVTGPEWISDPDQYGFGVTATMPVTTTREEYCGMLRNLLASRFHLSFHMEQQSRPGYELTILASGAKFKKYDPNAAGAEPDGQGVTIGKSGFALLSPKAPTGFISAFNPNGLVRLTFRNDMSALARELGRFINISDGIRIGSPTPRVIDKTGLTGVYDIHLEFAGPPLIPVPNAAPVDPADVGVNVFVALQQQLGLKLQKVRDITVDVLVIEHADQTPTAN
jgi:uncharacterized protein (TIGR03435 family)